VLPPPAQSGISASSVYEDVWSSQVAQAILPHIERSEGVEVSSEDPFSSNENLPMFVVQGWSDAR
jgi:hypothetical protein